MLIAHTRPNLHTSRSTTVRSGKATPDPGEALLGKVGTGALSGAHLLRASICEACRDGDSIDQYTLLLADREIIDTSLQIVEGR